MKVLALIKLQCYLILCYEVIIFQIPGKYIYREREGERENFQKMYLCKQVAGGYPTGRGNWENWKLAITGLFELT